MERMQATLKGKEDLSEVSKAQRCPPAKPLNHYRDNISNRQSAMAAASDSGGYTMRQVAEAFGVHYSTVIRAVKRQKAMRARKT